VGYRYYSLGREEVVWVFFHVSGTVFYSHPGSISCIKVLIPVFLNGLVSVTSVIVILVAFMHTKLKRGLMKRSGKGDVQKAPG
jgi:hypothetical protein